MMDQNAPQEETQTKKPLYKKWWVWAGVGVIAIGAIGASVEDDAPADAEETTTTEETSPEPEIIEVEAEPEILEKEVEVEVAVVPDICLDALDAGEDLIDLAFGAVGEAALVIGASGDAIEAAAMWDVDGLDSFTDLLDNSTRKIGDLTAKAEKNRFYDLKAGCIAAGGK